MEGEKRKLGDVGEMEGKKLREADEGATEEEVDEFFAIIRRIHVAVKYFENSMGGKKWRESFEKEGFKEVNGGVDGEKKEDVSVDENSGFDLNLVPQSKEDHL
ncbi:hypothetical protein K2173_016969 [Erythroxylum novogranatense]|uniref:Uncharacterized protein n=1 Tax=Erythroxylum novogranatense TaxID=1862640 RepID=A0AAV8U5J6_9ROSI|nr:hypothetical protein K2173_016969 [Erythroxylum novogranatense]